MLFGAHVSIAGGVENAPVNAHQAKCECFQLFTRSPRGGSPPPITPQLIKKFKLSAKKYKLKDYFIHTPYYINLASSNKRIKYGSINVIRDDLERGSLLGAKFLMTHLGSAKDLGEKEAIKEVISSLKKVLTGYKGSTQFLIENSAGSGQIIGDNFEEIGQIIKGVEKDIKVNIGVCFDTCHAFASGYDLKNKKAIDETLRLFDEKIGLKKLKMIHGNDSKTDFNSHVDRHEHIGLGKIGQEGFRAFVNHLKLKKLNLVIETPRDQRADDIGILKKLRK